MKVYNLLQLIFLFQAPKCQDSFRSSFPGPMPSSVRVPFRQDTLLETVRREHVQILSYVHFFLNAIEIATTKLETMMLGVKNATRDQTVIKDLDSMLSGLQLQFSCISSVRKSSRTLLQQHVTSSWQGGILC